MIFPSGATRAPGDVSGEEVARLHLRSRAVWVSY
jgi:hypothetical protein